MPKNGDPPKKAPAPKTGTSASGKSGPSRPIAAKALTKRNQPRRMSADNSRREVPWRVGKLRRGPRKSQSMERQRSTASSEQEAPGKPRRDSKASTTSSVQEAEEVTPYMDLVQVLTIEARGGDCRCSCPCESSRNRDQPSGRRSPVLGRSRNPPSSKSPRSRDLAFFRQRSPVSPSSYFNRKLRMNNALKLPPIRKRGEQDSDLNEDTLRLVDDRDNDWSGRDRTEKTTWPAYLLNKAAEYTAVAVVTATILHVTKRW